MADAKSVWSWRNIVKSSAEFYIDSIGRVSGWEMMLFRGFLLDVGLRQGCVMSPWLFNAHMDGVVRKVNVRELGKGQELLSATGRSFEVNQLLFADDTALVAGLRGEDVQTGE